jgi:lipopolysaccharide export system permease protein
MDPNASRNLGWTLYRYIGREVTFPFLFTLGGLTLAVASRDMLRLSDLLLNRGIEATKVAAIMIHRAIPIATEVLPLSLMVGALVALGRLVSDREIIALESLGISARRLHAPVVAVAIVVTLVAGMMTTVVAPWSRRSQDAVLTDISKEHPGSTGRAGLLHRFGNWRLQPREVSARGDRMRGVVLWTPGLGDTLFAEAGALDPDPGGSTRITLTNAALVLTSEERLSKFRFDSVTALLPETQSNPEHWVSEGPEAATLSALRTEASTAADAMDRRNAEAEIQRRFARPTATIFFGLLVISLFLARGAGSRASGGIAGLIAALVYYGLMQLTNGLIDTGAPVALAVWMPTIVLALAGGSLFLWAGRPSVFAWRMERSGGPAKVKVKAKAPAKTEPKAAAPEETESWYRRWPSSSRIRTHRWALQRYVARRFLVMLGFSFGVLLVWYLVIDILERLQWFARFNATASEAVRFYSFRIPLLISRLVPMALLVATALTVSVVAVQGELTGMRACGVPAPRGMMAVLVICGLIAPLSFVLNNEIVPRANTLSEYLQAREIKAEELWIQESGDGGPRPPVVWIRDGTRQLEAARLDPQLGIARGLTIYELGPDGLPTSRTDARGGRYIGGGVWRLSQATRVNVTGKGLERVEAARFSHLWETVPIEVHTRNMSVAVLREEIRNLQDEGHDPTIFQVDLFAKYAAPLGCLVLPAVAFFFAVSGPPYPSTAASLVVSVVVAVGTVLLTGLATSMGYQKVLPPMIAGMAPNLILASLALYLGLRLRGMFVRA